MMSKTNIKSSRRKRGTALLAVFAILTMLSMAAASYVNSATQTIRNAKRQTLDVQATHLCEAGTQAVLRNLWRPFKIDQNFQQIDDLCSGASEGNVKVAVSGEMAGVGRYSAGVIGIYSPNGDTYARIIKIRSVGYFDRNKNGVMDANEPRKIVDVSSRFELSRSKVFDYTYFINNYGWMDGFGQNDLIINGDMRANGNMEFLNGSPTVNGAIYAANNDKLSPPATGLINTAPVKWTNNTYQLNQNNVNTPSRDRWRQPYDPAVHGAKGSSQYEQWRDFVFDTDGSIQSNRIAGAAMVDSTGSRAWQRTSSGSAPTYTTLDTSPSQEVVMPDLSDLTYYQNLSTTYVDQKATFGDGSANPEYNNPAYIEVWDQTLNGGAGAYKRITTNGTITGSAVLIGTDAKPIKVHGPVTISQDAVIKGTIQGQGTIYTGRNVHIIGSIKYKNPPNFRGTDMQTIDNANEKKDMLALAARQSIIMGNPKGFGYPYPLYYMMPPFTKGRYDDAGNWIPPYDATQVDSSGMKKYQSVLGDNYLNTIAEGVNQIDAILYTNFVGGGNIGTGGGGVTMNGTIISKDEAMVCWSLPVRMNYDSRIRERAISKTPLIDLKLPRSPVMLRSTWQDRGLNYGGY